MLKSLYIENFALIEDIKINFNEGLTVLTGETGTGKSIILEALNLIFAKRSDQDMIRHEKDLAIVSATFILKPNLMQEYNLASEINIRREISRSGRHKILLNDEQISLAFLNELTNKIGSIHQQDDTFSLMDQNSYLSFIDQSDKTTINKLLNKYLLKRSDYLDAQKHLEKLKSKKNESIEQKEFLEYQYNELNSFNLQTDEKENLLEKIEVLKNFDKIANNLKEGLMILESLNFDSIYDLSNVLKVLAKYDKDFNLEHEKVLSMYYDLTETKSLVNDKVYKLDFDDKEYEYLVERHFELSKLEEKYGKSINELILFKNEIEEKIMMIDNYDDFIIKYEEKLKVLKDETYKLAHNLSNARKKISKSFETDVINELKELNLENTKFNVSFKESNSFLETGIDEIDFLISLNEGEPIKPLSKVASGGERARFMFAIKTIYARQNELSLLVLDEIDVGISGKTAAKMASKMKSLSNSLQLIVITHLPQVAAKAKNHYAISKNMHNGRMVTNINLLNEEERVLMIAMMLSDESLSHFAIEQAKILLDSSKN